jgi:hypothetical protein
VPTGTRTSTPATATVLVAVLGNDRLAALETDVALADADGLGPQADQLHLDAVARGVPDGAVRARGPGVRRSLRLLLRASLARAGPLAPRGRRDRP